MSGALSYKLSLDASQFLGPMRAAQAGLRGLLAAGSQIGNIATGLASAKTLLGDVVGILKSPITLAADMEDLNAEFKVMLGNAGAAKKMLADIQQFADATPFDPAGLSASAKTLLQFGVAGDSTLPILKMLGDVAMGSQEKLSALALVFGQVSSNGKLQGQDLLQLINAGFNPLNEMARTTGKSMAQLRDDMEKGAISADMVTAAFKSATSAGGLFFNGMAERSKTFNGQLSNLQAAWDELKRSLGGPISIALKPVLQEATKLLSDMTPMAKAFGEGLANSIRTAMALLKAGQIKRLFTEGVQGLGASLLSSINIGAITAIKLLGVGVKGAFEMGVAVLKDGHLWSGIRATMKSLVAELTADLDEMMAGLIRQMPTVLGGGDNETSKTFDNNAQQQRGQAKDWRSAAQWNFKKIDGEALAAPVQKATSEAGKILNEAFAALAEQVKNNPNFRKFGDIVEEFRKWAELAFKGSSASPDASTKPAATPAVGARNLGGARDPAADKWLDNSDPKSVTWRDKKGNPTTPPERKVAPVAPDPSTFAEDEGGTNDGGGAPYVGGGIENPFRQSKTGRLGTTQGFDIAQIEQGDRDAGRMPSLHGVGLGPMPQLQDAFSKVGAHANQVMSGAGGNSRGGGGGGNTAWQGAITNILSTLKAGVKIAPGKDSGGGSVF